jgi:hypothetical protein
MAASKKPPVRAAFGRVVVENSPERSVSHRAAFVLPALERVVLAATGRSGRLLAQQRDDEIPKCGPEDSAH